MKIRRTWLKNSFIWYFLCAVFIFFCGFYTFGLFDSFRKTTLSNETCGGVFSYTGKSLEGKFLGEGRIFYEGDEYVCDFTDGTVKSVQLVFRNIGDLCRCDVEDGELVNAFIRTFDGKTLLYDGDCFRYLDSDKNVYIGNLSDLGQTGTGKFVYSDGSVYEGDFSNGLANGCGKLTGKNKDGEFSYVGEFSDGIFSGTGEYITELVSYRGNFKENVPCGKGEYLSRKDNSFYEGDYKSGVFVKTKVPKKNDASKVSLT